MIEVGLLALEFDCLGEALDGLIELALPVQADSLIVVSVSIGRLYLNGRRVVLDGSIELSYLVIRKATIKESLEVRGQDFQGFAVEGDRGKVVSLLSGLVTLSVVGLCLLFAEVLLLGEWWLLLRLG